MKPRSLTVMKYLRLGFWMAAWGIASTAVSPALALDGSIQFTEEEKAYIAKVGAIRMCVDPDWVPFERINEQGKHEGIAADLVQLVAQRVGLRIELYPVKNWEASLAASKSGLCQITSFLNQTPARDKWLKFTDPIFFDQNIIVTREEHPYIGDLKWLHDKTVALPRGTMVEERIRSEYPELRIITTGSEPEAIALVSERKADMTVRSLIVAAYAIKKEGLFNLKISGQIPEFTNRLRIGVIHSEPVLRDILDKGVQTITPQEREAVTNQHVAINVQRGIDYTLVWQIILIGSLVIAVVVYWNRKLHKLNRELERLSVTDKLTGLANRQKIDQELDSEFLRCIRFGQPFSIILLDIDDFKAVNDTHGHQVGDQVLVEIAKLLQTHIRKTDFVGRWGGEEFMVICTQTDLSGAIKLAEHLRKLIEACPLPVVAHKTSSFGVAAYQSGDHANTLVSRADGALYEAKHRGRNRVESQ